MNDNDVANEMSKMVSFIKQEALEKAREIKVKADEEFNIEKAKLVRQETIAIEAFYQKKMKQAEVSRKISHSNYINKQRLKVLQARQQVLDELMQEARGRLSSLTSDPAKYQTLLKDLLLQTFYQLMESTVTVACRKKDVELVQKALGEAKAEYKKVLGTDVNATVDTQGGGIPDTAAGGALVSTNEGRILIANTLETRLELLGEAMLPDIRILIWGPSKQRTFYER